MSHYAKIENGLVKQVIVAEQDFIDTQEGHWVQTSYNTRGNHHPEGRPLRGNFASIGYVYDAENDVFYGPQPYPSWKLNKHTWTWEAPYPCTVDGVLRHWDENTRCWVPYY